MGSRTFRSTRLGPETHLGVPCELFQQQWHKQKPRFINLTSCQSLDFCHCFVVRHGLTLCIVQASLKLTVQPGWLWECWIYRQEPPALALSVTLITLSTLPHLSFETTWGGK